MQKTAAALDPFALIDALPPLAGVVPLPRAIPAGTALFRQGDRSIGVFVLVRGAVQLQRVTPDGAAVTLHRVRPGEMFAEASLFATHYHCDAVVERDSQALLYRRRELTAALRGDAEAMWTFASELARRLQGLRQRYELKQIRSAPQRVLQFLRLHCDADGGYRADGALKAVAAELGMSHEAFYRALAALEKQRLIARANGSLRLVTTGQTRKVGAGETASASG